MFAASPLPVCSHELKSTSAQLSPGEYLQRDRATCNLAGRPKVLPHLMLIDVRLNIPCGDGLHHDLQDNSGPRWAIGRIGRLTDHSYIPALMPGSRSNSFIAGFPTQCRYKRCGSHQMIEGLGFI